MSGKKESVTVLVSAAARIDGRAVALQKGKKMDLPSDHVDDLEKAGIVARIKTRTRKKKEE